MSIVPKKVDNKKSVYERITSVETWPLGTHRADSTHDETRSVLAGEQTAYEAFRDHLRRLADSDLEDVVSLSAYRDRGYKITVDRIMKQDGRVTRQFTDTLYVPQASTPKSG